MASPDTRPLFSKEYTSSNSNQMQSGSGRKKCSYRPNAKNRETLKRYKRGESIGFTLTASLKAKGLIPRTSKEAKGKKIVSKKYCTRKRQRR